jgi:hypothetical protein
MATLASKETDTDPASFKLPSQFVDYKNHYNISRCSVLHGGTSKRGYARAGSTVTLSVLPVHIAITQTRPHLQSAVCQSMQFATSINNVVSQPGSRPASCIADVDCWRFGFSPWLGREMKTTEMHSYTDWLMNGFIWTLQRGYADCLSWDRADSW